ncbi:glycosyltransferase [Tessaracoccus sp. Z1128]
MSRATVVLLSSVYPYAPGEEFLTPEIAHWSRDGVKLILMPWRTTDRLRDLPEGIVVDDRLSKLRERHTKRQRLLELASPSLWREVVASVRAGSYAPKALWRVLVSSAAGSIVARALGDLASEQGRPTDLVYSYWFDFYALGALRAPEAVRRILSRAHGYDIYEELSPDRRLPFRGWMSSRVDVLAPISEAGLRAARRSWDLPPERSRCMRLGVSITDDVAPIPFDHNELNLLSVSSLMPVKRVDRLIDTLRILAEANPQRRIRWSHAGSGPLADSLRASAVSLPDNVEVSWLGQLDSDVLARTYASRPWNFMINVSSSEGVPVSLMEAMCRAIPVAATDVGGTQELVAPPGGVILHPDAPSTTWAGQIEEALPSSMEEAWRRGFRDEVVRHWDQSANFAAFVDEALALAQR